jgi:hypothetical protein
MTFSLIAFLKPQQCATGQNGEVDSEAEFSLVRHQQKLSDEKFAQLRQMIGMSWADPDIDASEDSMNSYWAAGVCKMYGVYSTQNVKFDKVKSYILEDSDYEDDPEEQVCIKAGPEFQKTIGVLHTRGLCSENRTQEDSCANQNDSSIKGSGKKKSVVINPFPDIYPIRKCSGDSRTSTLAVEFN